MGLFGHEPDYASSHANPTAILRIAAAKRPFLARALKCRSEIERPFLACALQCRSKIEHRHEHSNQTPEKKHASLSSTTSCALESIHLGSPQLRPSPHRKRPAARGALAELTENRSAGGTSGPYPPSPRDTWAKNVKTTQTHRDHAQNHRSHQLRASKGLWLGAGALQAS